MSPLDSPAVTKSQHIKVLFVALVLVSVSLVINTQLKLDTRLYAAWKTWITPESTKHASVWLPHYQLFDKARLDAIEDDLSGITFNPDTQTFWVIVNSPQRIYEIDQQFQVLRQIELINFQDTEALAYVGENRFVIADERDQSVVVASIETDTSSLDKYLLRRITLDTGDGGNKGFEGIAVDAKNDRIYVVRERDPKKLLAIRGLLSADPGLVVETVFDAEIARLSLDDFSGLHFDPVSGNLLVLSDESKAIYEIDPSAHKISHINLLAGFHGLGEHVPQAEGVTLGPDRSLVVVSEPNLVYRFRR
jgi:uncharacterized protein YjiK